MLEVTAPLRWTADDKLCRPEAPAPGTSKGVGICTVDKMGFCLVMVVC